MMARWWDGWTLRQVAEEHGISRQRVHVLLMSVACTRKVRDLADTDGTDSGHRARADHVDRAWELLSHRIAHRLTPRQRGVLAWRTQGLVPIDIARRMGCRVQTVHDLLVAARRQLTRMETSGLRRRNRQDVPTLEPIDIEALISNVGPHGHP
ncbi:unnamed protein product [marine sediment metagenome]|uniref:Uncharacterized protein n=1 Tax=marine sediment metagenome TaxID=412755 RepID=X0REK1_9ZZZZ